MMAALSLLEKFRGNHGQVIFCAALLLAWPGSAGGEDRTSLLRSVVIEGTLDGDVTCLACSVVVNGEVTGDVVTLGGDITVRGSIHGDAVAAGGSIRALGAARMDGDVVAVGGFATADAGANVKSADGFVSRPWVHMPGQRDMGWRGILGLTGFHLACILFSVLLLRTRRLHNIARSARQWVLAGVLGAGVLLFFSFLFDFASDLPRFSNIVEALLSAILLLLLATGIAGAALALGELRKSAGAAAALATGGMALLILQLLPVAGLAVMILLAVWASGAAVLSGMGFRSGVPHT